jgi:hypothetical protein
MHRLIEFYNPYVYDHLMIVLLVIKVVALFLRFRLHLKGDQAGPSCPFTVLVTTAHQTGL